MHGMIMVVYLLTAFFLGGFGNYLIPLMCGARDMVFPFLNMLSFWFYFVSVIILISSYFVPGGPTGAGWTLYPPQAILQGTPGHDWGILMMLGSLAVFIIAFTMGGLNYVTTVLQARCRGMTPDAYAADDLVNFYRYYFGSAGISGVVCQRRHADV